MSEKTFDIISLIENNPITKLSCTYNNKLLEKIKTQFNDTQQQLFLSSFYCYLNCDSEKDFIIDLDNIWKWCGFSRKDPAKRILEQNFKKEKEYIISLPNRVSLHQSVKQDIKHGGSNKEQILMTIKTFKKFCMKARTDKADEIHEYYIKLEELLQETLEEESKELRGRLLEKEKQIENNINTNFDKKPVVYIGYTEDNIVKFGYTNDIINRTKIHKKEINETFNIELIYECCYNREIEQKIKQDNTLSGKRIKKQYNNKIQTELLQLNEEFTIEKLDKKILQLKEDVIKEETEKDKDAKIKALELEIYQLKENHEKEINYYREQLSLLKVTRSTPKIKMIDFVCSLCHYTTGNKYHIDRHIKTKCKTAQILEKETVNQCKYCDRLYKTKNSLRSHIHNKHKKELEKELNEK